MSLVWRPEETNAPKLPMINPYFNWQDLRHRGDSEHPASRVRPHQDLSVQAQRESGQRVRQPAEHFRASKPGRQHRLRVAVELRHQLVDHLVPGLDDGRRQKDRRRVAGEVQRGADHLLDLLQQLHRAQHHPGPHVRPHLQAQQGPQEDRPGCDRQLLVKPDGSSKFLKACSNLEMMPLHIFCGAVILNLQRSYSLKN